MKYEYFQRCYRLKFGEQAGEIDFLLRSN